MKKLTVFFYVIFLFGVFENNSMGNTITISFDDLAPGTQITTQYANLGVQFSLLDSNLFGPFSYNLPIEDDIDIFGATGNGINPGNSFYGPYYDVKIKFENQIDYFSILALDLEGVATVKLYNEGVGVLSSDTDELGTILGFWDQIPRGPVRLVEAGGIGGSLRFDEIIIGNSAGGPEVMDNVKFHLASDVVPIPSAIWLLGSGLIGLVGFRKCRKGGTR